MKEVINKIDAIEAVYKIMPVEYRVFATETKQLCDRKEFVDALETLPSADAEWIPCSERLPEYMKTVIISTFWGVKTGYLDSTEVYGDFWEIIEDDATTALHNIYAWMPLPKPYREDSEV